MEYGAICTPFIFVVYAKSKYLCVLISNEMGKNKLEKFADMASYSATCSNILIRRWIMCLLT